MTYGALKIVVNIILSVSSFLLAWFIPITGFYLIIVGFFDAIKVLPLSAFGQFSLVKLSLAALEIIVIFAVVVFDRARLCGTRLGDARLAGALLVGARLVVA